MKLILSFVAVLMLGSLFAQQPSYFKIGEEELSGVHIYDLIQDQESNYLIATNNGLYKYDFYEFVKIECPEMTSSSVFNLAESVEGDIYCNNLSGQIFKISDYNCELFFQIPDSLMYHEIGLNFNDKNQLTILAASLFLIHPNKEIEIVFKLEESTFYGDLTANDQGGLYFFSNADLFIYRYENDEVTKIDTFDANLRPTTIFTDGQLLVFDQSSGVLSYPSNYSTVSKKNQLMTGPIIYSDGQNIWKASRTGGARLYSSSLSPLFKEELVFREYFLSAMTVDKEGNTLLGTFGDGILVVPQLNTEEYKIKDSSEGVVKVKATPNGSLFMGCRSGKIFELTANRELNLISDISKKNIEYLEYLPSENALIFDGSPSKSNPYMSTLSYEIASKNFDGYELSSLKDIKHIGNGKYLVGHNVGVMWFEPSLNKYERIKSFDGRTNAVAYENVSETIYSGSSSGLKIGNNEKGDFFEINGQPIICRHMLNFDSKIYISTQKNGVLIFQNGENIEKWDVFNGLPSNNILEMSPCKNGFILSTEIGVFRISEDGKGAEKFSTSVGLIPKKAIDIEVFQNKLYCVYKDAIRILDLDNLNKESYTPNLSISRWEVNDSLMDHDNRNLVFEQNKIAFYFSSKSLKYRNEIIYHFKLSSVDNRWQTQPYGQNKVEYKSLPPGKYTFSYYATYENEKGEIKTFEFQIAFPYWKTWWFILICLMLFVCLVFGVYRFQIKRQRKLSKIRREMIESKLTAIQSQMNPHFIFNSLNSIQDLVLQQQGENAYNYISKFAFLVRQVLHNSELDFVRLENEIKVLDVYLELEQLRFDDDFTFEIINNVDEDVEIPPMIIQPFVENAIKHGLLHLDGDKELILRFELANDILSCTIKDNGVGREKSKAINERKAKNHQSFSTKSIQNRFDILQNIHGGKLGLVYEDLKDKGLAKGTIVHLKIPVKRDY